MSSRAVWGPTPSTLPQVFLPRKTVLERIHRSKSLPVAAKGFVRHSSQFSLCGDQSSYASRTNPQHLAAVQARRSYPGVVKQARPIRQP